MKRVLLYILGVALLITANNLVNLSMHKYKRADLIGKQNQTPGIRSGNPGPQVILIGSSTTKSGYLSDEITSELNLQNQQLLNLATMPNNAEINLQILKSLKGHLRGSIVLYGLDPWIYSEYYYQNFNYKLSRWTVSQRVDYVKLAQPKFGKIMDVINGGNIFNNLEQLYLRQTDNKTADVKDKDWQGKDPMASLTVEKWFNYPTYGISSDFIDALRLLDGFCYAQGCKLVIYVPGYSDSFIKGYKDIGFHELLSSKIRQNVKHSEIDLSLLGMDDELFWDGIHVKPKGKELHTARIIRIIQSKSPGREYRSTA